MEDTEAAGRMVDENKNVTNDASNIRISDVLFSSALENCGIALLKKSQTPVMKAEKKKAFQEMIDYILLRKGIRVTEQQIAKKINNMKTRIKSKVDMKATGNRKICLNEGEKTFFRLMGAEENPAVAKLSYGASAGTSAAKQTTISETSSFEETEVVPGVLFDMEEDAVDVNMPISVPKPPTKQKCDQKQHDSETPETSRLSTSELQRLVLWKQLEIFEEQKKLFKRMEETIIKVEHFINSYISNQS